MTNNPYAPILEAFPADVEVTRYDDRVEFRIAGESKSAVIAETERISSICAGKAPMAEGRPYLRFLGPVSWGIKGAEEYVVYGELRLVT